MKNFFLSSDFYKRALIVGFVLLFFSPKLLIIEIFIIIALLLLFRAPSFIKIDKGQANQNMVFSPVNGVIEKIVEKDNKSSLIIKVGFLDGYSLVMPFSGEVTSYDEYEKGTITSFGVKGSGKKTKISIRAKSTKNIIKVKHKSSVSLKSANLWCRTGDRAKTGATLGYLPFGGKLAIELPKSADILVENNQRIHAGDTMLASIEE